nr:PREDICTED: zona pellucida sperm-binding protein 3-like [Lepisosteus oculatus]
MKSRLPLSVLALSWLFGLTAAQLREPGGSTRSSPRGTRAIRKPASIQRPRIKLPEFGNPDDQPPALEALTPELLDGAGAPLPGEVRRLLKPAPPKRPAPPSGPRRAVSVTCTGSKMIVRVRPAFHGFGATGGELTLGSGCKSNGRLRPSGDLLFRYPLLACGSQKRTPIGYIVYRNVLHYIPAEEPGPVRRSHPINVGVECRYKRYHYSYKLAVHPTWQPPSLLKPLENEKGGFKLQLMSDDWMAESDSNIFYVGESINFQASARRLAAGKKLYIKSCHAALSADPSSQSIYSVIQNYGCMVDSKIKGSISKFVPPRTDSTIKFTIDAFQFKKKPLSKMFLHCTMFVTSSRTSQMAKSCTYDQRQRRWEELEGAVNSACRCCQSSCTAPKTDSPPVVDVRSSRAFVIASDVLDAIRRADDLSHFASISLAHDDQPPAEEDSVSEEEGFIGDEEEGDKFVDVGN